ncbi:MAG: Rrf2 family transcriptional regulator [Bacteroidetes bacterium]|nr:Rrf2 family transcriptional regulator [Bacteroidota bacterium]
MRLRKTAEYALRIMNYMAIDEQKLYTTTELFESLNIPFRYLRKLMINLSKSEILTSVQGKYGGYKIARKSLEISLLEIIHATGEDPVGDVCFFGFEKCAFVEKCAMHEKWTLVRDNINQVLSKTTLAEIKGSESTSFIKNNISIFT